MFAGNLWQKVIVITEHALKTELKIQTENKFFVKPDWDHLWVICCLMSSLDLAVKLLYQKWTISSPITLTRVGTEITLHYYHPYVDKVSSKYAIHCKVQPAEWCTWCVWSAHTSFTVANISLIKLMKHQSQLYNWTEFVVKFVAWISSADPWLLDVIVSMNASLSF